MTDIATQAKITITSLFQQTLEQAIPLEQLNIILATPPPESWVKVHPNIPGHRYLPIDKVEYLLRACFKKFKIEVKESKQLLNAISVTVRVHYLNPAINEMMFHDGLGAWDLQTKAKSGTLQMDMSNLNRGAVPMALGIAKSVAIKDACDHFGTLFGANLNRKDTKEFEGNADLLTMDERHAEIVELFEAKQEHLTSDEIADARRIIDQKESRSYNKLLTILNNK